MSLDIRMGVRVVGRYRRLLTSMGKVRSKLEEWGFDADTEISAVKEIKEALLKMWVNGVEEI